MSSMPSGPADSAHIGGVARAPKAAQLIAMQLRRQIVRGELATGETLPPEGQLLEQYGVSRPTLREAYRILETESLISVQRGARGGAQVMSPDLAAAQRGLAAILQFRGATSAEVYEAFVVHESYCVRLLAARRTRIDLLDLAACVDGLLSAVATFATATTQAEDMQPEDRLRCYQPIGRFHGLLLERCGNAALGVQAEILADMIGRHLRQTVPRSDAAEAHCLLLLRRTVRAHRTLVSLLEAKDADAAERYWRSHLEANGEVLFRHEGRDRQVIDLFH